ncbi:hypothetical protein ACSSNL_13425 [Thalassobius sp. S69A]|uniref:hypothetical protein n=1 Tax=unclassified Thalassovita TaxID=2619711 RepID=UPI003C7A26B6
MILDRIRAHGGEVIRNNWQITLRRGRLSDDAVKWIRAIDADIKTANVSDADLRKSAVAKVLGDDMVQDASDAEITGMFKAVAKDAAKGDQFAAAVRDGIQSGADMTVADKAYTDNITDLSNAWMGAKKEA